MDRFKSILVDLDATAAVHPAMDRAIELARASGAKLKIVEVVTVPNYSRRYLPQGAVEFLVSSRLERLAAIAGADTRVASEFDVLTGRPAIALVQEVLRSGHDLVIRSHARDLAARGAFGTIDMQLLRQCPCPVWIVGPGATTAPRRVLAAVHAEPEDAEETALNTKIIETALLMTQLDGGALALFQAWTAFGEILLRHHSKPEEVVAYVEDAKRAARDSLDDLVKSFGARLAAAQVELIKGDAEEIIPPFVVSRGIDLVVMGTSARKGIAGLVIGNTAERLLQRLVCSVLAVKPDGFVTDVRLDA